jgi:rhodanese-related sulfurtransferase
MKGESMRGTVASRAANPPYAGDVDAKRAWEILAAEPKAILVDVRTKPEWEFVGVPSLDTLGRQPLFIAWQVYPTMDVNPRFADDLTAAGIAKDATVLFICRSGGRSRSAAIAATAAGYRTCYNVSGGFEGPHDPLRHRGGSDGWKALGLPWVQG